MSIKSRLFGKPWQHRDAQVRAQAVAEGDDPELKRELGRLAEHDESEQVRLAALRRIDTEPFWLDARLRESDPAIVAAADEFLRRAVMRRPDDSLIKERLEWLRRIDDADFIRQVACHAPDRSLRADALERINAQGFLGDRVVEEPDEELALSLIGRIEQASTLERIGRTLRAVSKKRSRAVEQRLHDLQAASGSYDPAVESATRLVARAEALARGKHEGDRRIELDAIEQQWRKLDRPSQALQRRLDGALAIVRRAIERPSTRPSPLAGDAPQDGEAGKADPDLEALEERIAAAGPLERLRPEPAGELLAAFDRAWSRITTPGPPDLELRERLLPSLRVLQAQRQSVATSPASEPRREESFDWAGELDRVAERLDGGHIVEAQSALRDLRSRLDRLKPGQRPRQASGRLTRLEGRLREMRNWEHWSNNKIRDQLIERVERLAGSGQHPDAISAALKEARAEWQRLEDLEVLPGDKRRHAAPAGQWRRFQAACKNAFEQAQPFFEKRHEVQAENLEQLEAFLERGQAVAGDETSDLEQLKQFMRKSRLAIRRLDDLPPKSRGRAAARLRELMDAISGRLDTAFEEIENAKRRLVREAQALAHESDLAAAIEQAKALQARWQKTGNGRRRVDQKLWQEFRAPIDPLFEQLQGQRDERRQQLEAENSAMSALVEQAEQLAEAGDEDLPAAQARMRALRDEWAGSGARPDKLASRFEQAGQKLSRRIDDLRRAERRREIDRLDALAQAVQSLWQARLDGERSDLSDQLPSDTPGGEHGQSLLAVAQDLANPACDPAALHDRVASNAEQARQVVIEMEFLAGMDSPPEDREARMNFQVRRLASRMGDRTAQPSLAGELAKLRQRWYGSFPQASDRYQALTERFRKCQNVLESMSGTE